MPLNEVQQVLFVFDGMTRLPDHEQLVSMLKSHYVHIIVLWKAYESPDKLIKEVDRKLVRGCTLHTIDPLTRIHSTQRLVHTVMKKVYFAPKTADQQMFEQLAEFTTGSPPVVDITSQILLASYSEDHSKAPLQICSMFTLKNPNQVMKNEPCPAYNPPGRSLSVNVISELSTIVALSDNHRDVWETDSIYDSWDSITTLIDNCGLSAEENFLLNCLSAFGPCPVPLSLVTSMSSLITESGQKVHISSSLHKKLMQYHLMKCYPLPVALYPLSGWSDYDTNLVYIPHHLAECLWKKLEDADKLAVLCAVRLVVCQLHQFDDTDHGGFIPVLAPLLLKIFEQNYSLVGKECYQSILQFTSPLF